MRYRSRYARGQFIVFYAIALAALLGTTALCTDVAVMYWNWLSMQKAVDAAAIAGANYLPEDPTTASNQAVNFGELNGLSAKEIGTPTVPVDLSSITVKAARNVPYFFGRVLGLTQQLIQVSATAGAPAPLQKVGGADTTGAAPPAGSYGTTLGEYPLIPIGLDWQTPYNYDQPVTLNYQQVGPGDWGSLALGGTGGANERSNLANGYSGPISVGDWITTEPGKKVGPVDQGITDRLNSGNGKYSAATFASHPFDDPRAVVLPLVDWSTAQGRGAVLCHGFAMVWIDSVNGGTIQAHFIRQVVPDSLPNTQIADTGARGIPALTK
jgi:hypothetical protein